MKLHYFNILLYSLPLNILLLSSSQVYVHRNHYSITLYTSKTPKPIKSNRSLCECDLYKPNYDNDPEMKNLMENFSKQTQQRFNEYDEHMNEKLQKCKEQCEKDIQNIILKDKIEKELTEKLSALQTDISIKDIPTCICEKSVADKMEKNCLKCGRILGTSVPELALLWGVSTHLLGTAATSAATKAGMKAVVAKLNEFVNLFEDTFDLAPIVNESSYNSGTTLYKGAMELFKKSCKLQENKSYTSFCNSIELGKSTFNDYAQAGSVAYDTTLKAKMAEIPIFNTAMMASIIAIVVIVLVMVIIYLILRYRRKKKMKKKVQYLKLLNQ
ncbi:rifin [Plasmodium sp. gorilla clade G1]|nr:rifin [Plasmodium sp. gorilla clade G1]